MLPLPETPFLKAPDVGCLGVVHIFQSFQVRRAITLYIEHPQRLERSIFPCCLCSDVSCKLEYTKVRMRKGLAQGLHHFRDGIMVTVLYVALSMLLGYWVLTTTPAAIPNA